MMIGPQMDYDYLEAIYEVLLELTAAETKPAWMKTDGGRAGVSALFSLVENGHLAVLYEFGEHARNRSDLEPLPPFDVDRQAPHWLEKTNDQSLAHALGTAGDFSDDPGMDGFFTAIRDRTFYRHHPAQGALAAARSIRPNAMFQQHLMVGRGRYQQPYALFDDGTVLLIGTITPLDLLRMLCFGFSGSLTHQGPAPTRLLRYKGYQCYARGETLVTRMIAQSLVNVGQGLLSPADVPRADEIGLVAST